MKLNNEKNIMSDKVMNKLEDDDMKAFKYELDNTLPKPKKCKSFKLEINELNEYIDMINPFKMTSLVKNNSPTSSKRSKKKKTSSDLSIISHNNPERQLTPKLKKTLSVNANSELSTITVCYYYKIIYYYNYYLL
jgi:hypothetical protein